MSTRAYKLIEIKTADSPTFNLSHDWEFVQKYALESENESIIQFNRDEVEAGLKNEKSEDYRGILRDVLADMGDEDYVEYYCY